MRFNDAQRRALSTAHARTYPEQGAWLKQVVSGFFAYHAAPTNGPALGAFYYHVTPIWLRTLRRRGEWHCSTFVNAARENVEGQREQKNWPFA